MSTPAAPAFTIPEDVPARLAGLITSFRLELRSGGSSPKTIKGYLEAAIKLARWLRDEGVIDWADADKTVMKTYMAWFMNDGRKANGDPYSMGYANNQFRALQQFWRWYADENDTVNPMTGMRPPRPDEKVVPIVDIDKLRELIMQAEKRKDFESRRDTALLRFFCCTGCRLSEVAGLQLADINLETNSALVLGKGRKERIVKFDWKCAKALDRYINGARPTHKLHGRPELWLGVKNRDPLTSTGIAQIIVRRGRNVGLDLNPHQLRHTFTHLWLDKGGAEGDLMELNGWTSPQMLRRYGASARGARAQRAYDRVDVLGDI